MSAQSEALNAVLTEFRQMRAVNAAKETQRFSEIAEKHPEIGMLHKSRLEMILNGLRQALSGHSVQSDPSDIESVNRSLCNLLTEKGYPPDYLQPIYNCTVCHDTGYVGESVREMCQCLKTSYHSRLYAAIGLNEQTPQTFESFNPKIYSDEPIPDISLSPRKVALNHMRTAQLYAEMFPRTATPDLLFLGKSGVGKTFLMHAIAHRVLERGYQVLCVSAYRVIEMARSAHFRNDPEEIRAIFEAELLMIDDLGAEPLMENITIPYLYNLINERQQTNMHTVITTNLSKDTIKERYTERISSRLLDPQQCTVLPFVGADIRKRREV
jgi:DNA replication protein DnaC